MVHDLEKEERFLSLLGYFLIGPNNSNRWSILDKKGENVGYIQYKRIIKKNNKKGYVKIMGYDTLIDSDKVHWKNTRHINDKFGNIYPKDSMSSYYQYNFTVKRKNKDNDKVEMSLGENPSISIWSTQYGFLSVGIDYRGLNFHFNSKTESFVIEEFLSYWNNVYDDKKMYCYQIRNRRKEVIPTFTNDKMITREIIGTFEQYYDKLKITQSTWVYNKLRYRKESLVDGSIQEMAEKHQMGIDSFQCFRYLINKALPFKKDIVKELFPDEIIEQNNLELFFPDYKKKKISTQKVLK